MKSFFARLAVFAVLVLLASVPAWAQETALAGTVADPTGAVVPGAEVIATNQATGAVRTAHTGADGKYLFTQMAPGTYKIEVKSTGFKAAQAANVAVPISVTTRFDVTLAVGDVAETITVESETARINTTDASLGVPFSGSEVNSLPSLDRNPAALLSLQTGVTFVAGSVNPGGYGSQSTAEHRTGSVSGARSDQTNITLDGVDVNDPITGMAFFSALRVTQESLQEFRVTTSNYNAEQGRSSAAQVSLVTKSGTNDIHGSAYYLHRNEAFNANDFFLNRAGQEEGAFRRHLYGASLGGPIIKNRFFLFGNWERNEESLFDSAERSVPAMHMRDGVFIYPCSTNAGFATCPTTSTSVQGLSGTMWTVPADHYGLSPAEIDALDRGGPGPSLASLTAWAALPQPNSSGSSDGINILGFRFAAPISNTFNTYIARADIHIDRNANHTVFWRG
ncbi:MAG TPA: carboxypeptidase-like regulatory domain-containing protein, partial [Terriglobales bacterium]